MNQWLQTKKNAKLMVFGGVRERERRALSLLQAHATEWGKDRMETSVFDVKRDFYRPLQLSIQALLLYHGLGSQSTLRGIAALKQKKVISSKGAKSLTHALRLTLNLRMQTHLFYYTKKELVCCSRSEADLGTGLFSSPESTVQILEILKVLMSLHKAVQSFLQGDQKVLSHSTLFDGAFGGIRSGIFDARLDSHLVVQNGSASSSSSYG